MTARLAHIYRHPIKSHGREELGEVTLAPGQTMPWDRYWAVTHERSKWKPGVPKWMGCANFLLGSGNARIMAVNARLDPTGPSVTLTHPELPDLTLNPDLAADEARFLAWVAPLLQKERQAIAVVKAPGRGMTDTDYPSLSICNLASNADLGAALGAELSPLRWRGNLWIEGWQPWAEASMIGQSLRIGAAEFDLREPIKRCKATTANPMTGVADVDTLAGLRTHTGQQNMGVYAVVTKGGTLRVGDPVEMIE